MGPEDFISHYRTQMFLAAPLPAIGLAAVVMWPGWLTAAILVMACLLFLWTLIEYLDRRDRYGDQIEARELAYAFYRNGNDGSDQAARDAASKRRLL